MRNLSAQQSGAHYDVAVVGAGPGGSATAYFLAKDGLRVALFDKFEFPRDKTCGDGLTPRAIKTLAAMGVLSQIEERAFRSPRIKMRYSDEITFNLELDHLKNLPRYILTMPRFQLDDVLRQYAVNAGVHFFPRARVKNLTRLVDKRVSIQTESGPVIECALAVIATGANSSLLQKLGLLKKSPPVNLAARTYFENIKDLDDSLILFFDGINLPGYGWVFPTGEGTANIGCGVFFEDSVSQASRLRGLIAEHPYLQRILKNARQVAPIQGYPLRTDFSPSHSGNEWILVVGEAAGLVNPISGEGIDYALESAHLAANAILNGWQDGFPSTATQKKYRTALGKKFQFQFILNHLIQKIYFRNGIWTSVLKSACQKPTLRKAMVDAVVGTGNPLVMFTPRVLRDVFLQLFSGRADQSKPG
ncbi:MAG: geranylgeranyl reductase family protein [Chloroflexi bacterium]|nr:geranylgeranyl reductase family protein [Chloroflexota bacterium]